MMSDPWKEIEQKLAEWIGLDAASVGSKLVPRAVKLRMIAQNLTDVAAYASLLMRSDVEREALIEEVVIPESWFFRDVAPFRLLQEHARAGWLLKPARSPLRVLSVPCAGGEEPYSIAIALHESGLAGSRFIVDAVDISSRQLEHARLGIYSANAFRGEDLMVRERYFRKVPQGYALDQRIREQVRFRQSSLLNLTVPQGEPRYDVVFCRNLLIYLTNDSRARAMGVIDRLLAEDGLLIIGHADRLASGEGVAGFVPTGDRSGFAYRRSTDPGISRIAALPGPAEPSRRSLPPPLNHNGKAPFATALNSPVKEFPQARPHPSSKIQSSDSTAAKGVTIAAPSGSLLEQASILANSGKHEEAITTCRASINREGPSSAAYYLMGMIYGSMEDVVQADESLSRAVYLDPSHDEALLALALNAERRGDAVAGAGYRRRAERAALKKGGRSR